MGTKVNDTPETGFFDLQLAATIDKSGAVACGRDIARLFSRLLPLYQAAVTH